MESSCFQASPRGAPMEREAGQGPKRPGFEASFAGSATRYSIAIRPSRQGPWNHQFRPQSPSGDCSSCVAAMEKPASGPYPVLQLSWL